MKRVLIPLAHGVEELEAVTVIDLLRRANIEVIIAGLLDIQPIIGSHKIKISPDKSLDEVINENFNMIVLLGGLSGVNKLNADYRIHMLLQKFMRAGHYIAAICAAPKILANAGLLNGKKATSYPGLLEKVNPSLIKIKPDAVICDGKIITSRGPGTAIDFTLTLIEKLVNFNKRSEVELTLVR